MAFLKGLGEKQKKEAQATTEEVADVVGPWYEFTHVANVNIWVFEDPTYITYLC